MTTFTPLSIRIDTNGGRRRMVTSRDVARVAGVSQSTVSYVMSGRRSISAATRRRVEAAIEELTYHPNAGARALASQRTQVIGLVVPFTPGADTTGLLPFIETIASCARAADHDVLLVTADEGSAGLKRLAGRSLCDAIVMMDIETDDARIPVAATLSVPVILIGVPGDNAGLHCVDLDFPLAGRMAVEELAALGHRRVVLVGHPAEVVERGVNFVGRFQRGAADAASAHGVALEVVAPVAPGRDGAEAAVEQALAVGAAGSGRPEFAGAPAGAAGPVGSRAPPGSRPVPHRTVHRRCRRGRHAGRHQRLARTARCVAAGDADPVPAARPRPGTTFRARTAHPPAPDPTTNHPPLPLTAGCGRTGSDGRAIDTYR
jgi:DNA-binding LacI/PurR family transcriptional regulator